MVLLTQKNKFLQVSVKEVGAELCSIKSRKSDKEYVWQANPDAGNMDIINAIKKSSSQFYAPDNKLGYGIPNFRIADSILKDQIDITNKATVAVCPNPCKKLRYIEIYGQREEEVKIEIYNSIGKLMYTTNKTVGNGFVNYLILDDIYHFKSGLYILKLQYGGTSKEVKIVKG